MITLLQKFKEIMNFSSTHGLNLPSAYDNNTKKGSVSLLFAHLTFILTIGGIMTLMVKDLTLGVYCSIGYSALMLGFYLLRKGLNKFKIGKDGLELDSNDNNEEGNNK